MRDLLIPEPSKREQGGTQQGKDKGHDVGETVLEGMMVVTSMIHCGRLDISMLVSCVVVGMGAGLLSVLVLLLITMAVISIFRVVSHTFHLPCAIYGFQKMFVIFESEFYCQGLLSC